MRITNPTVLNRIPPKGGRSLRTLIYCSFPWSGGTCQHSDNEQIVLSEGEIFFLHSLNALGGTVEPQFLIIALCYSKICGDKRLALRTCYQADITR